MKKRADASPILIRIILWVLILLVTVALGWFLWTKLGKIIG